MDQGKCPTPLSLFLVEWGPAPLAELSVRRVERDGVTRLEGEGKSVSARVYDMVTQWGGSISAEHGIGQMKVSELDRLADPVSLEMMRRVKQALDPQGLLNPGKLLAK